MRNREVLISGGSVAGPALAFWLRRYGFTTTIVERAPAPRTGGQAIDIRGAAIDVVRWMGLLERVRAAGTAMRGMSFVDAGGRPLVSLTELTLTGGATDGPDIEVMRDELVELLYGATRDDTEYLFDDSITALRDGPDGVYVDFERGGSRRFDMVIGADGQHSRVRALAFGPEERFLRHLGMAISVFSAPNLLGLDRWQEFHLAERKVVGAYSARRNTQSRIMFGFSVEPGEVDLRDPDQQRRLIARRFAGVGWRTPEFLDAMWAAPDFYLDAMSQVRLPRWSSGRIGLVGDAAYGPSPLSGQGTSLALVGAYVLAGELASAGDGNHARGFERYQERMAGFVEANQALALSAAKRKGTRFGNWCAIQVMRAMSRLPFRRQLVALSMRPLRRAADGIELPDYWGARSGLVDQAGVVDQ
ncbi:FAD-dependent monooxygenase [Pseudonocardia acaciae]|uniref:FAD-dependent monooxygenase n=1 Tax=Pseudonocardia acaciae TaxID=551276 RepID=UPI0006879358|nr:FAD-dependent monooxygenase [Pseudonocardia acaciae]